MPRVFGHGGLRLVLLSVLEDGPKHGYEIIVALEQRFMGMYRPSSGTVYPRLAALEEEGLIAGEDVAGRRVYRLTDAGREELQRRRSELDETVLTATSAVLAAMHELQAEVRSTVAAVQADLGLAVADARRQTGDVSGYASAAETAAREAWRASENSRRLAVEEAKRVRRAADELRRQAGYEARVAARQAGDLARDALRDAGRAAAEAAVKARAARTPGSRPPGDGAPFRADTATAGAGTADEPVDTGPVGAGPATTAPLEVANGAGVGGEPAATAPAPAGTGTDAAGEPLGSGPRESGASATDAAVARARAGVDDLAADVARWAGEAAEQVRRHLPDDAQRARLWGALAEARRVFLETLVGDPDQGADGPTGAE